MTLCVRLMTIVDSRLGLPPDDIYRLIGEHLFADDAG
jgi:hypothetical protein